MVRETPAAARPQPRKLFWQRNENLMLGTVSMLVFLAFWELAVVAGWVNPLFSSSPSRIVAAAVEMFADGSIYGHLRVSGIEFIIGFALAIVIGVPLGILMGWYS